MRAYRRKGEELFVTANDEETLWPIGVKNAVGCEGGPGTRIAYRIYATADIPGAIDPSKTIELAVTDAGPTSVGLGDVSTTMQTAKTLRE